MATEYGVVNVVVFSNKRSFYIKLKMNKNVYGLDLQMNNTLESSLERTHVAMVKCCSSVKVDSWGIVK
jgi:hypothetical protein